MSERDNPYSDSPYSDGYRAGGASFGDNNAAANMTVSFGGTPSAAANPAPAGDKADLIKPDLIKDATTASFPTDVIAESRNQPVLVDFWAPWCGPCRQLAPVIEKVVAESAGKVRLVKLNIDDHPSIPGQLGIQSIPAVIAFKDGQPVDGFMGAVPEGQIREFIDRLTVDDTQARIEEALQAAAEARTEGDPQTSAQIYAAILQQNPENVEALAALADLLFEAGQVERATEVLERIPAASRDVPAVAAVRARMALAEQVAGLGNPAELAQRLAANPADHEARFDLALIANARDERGEAVDHLIAIMKADRAWNDDGARKKLLELFEAWGMKDPATLAGRRKLSTLLFA